MNSYITILLTTIIFIVASQNRSIRKLRREISVETAIINFTTSQNVSFDSVFVKKDTVFFFNKKNFVGKSVTVRK